MSGQARSPGRWLVFELVVAACVHVAIATALTWPVVVAGDEVLVGGGELGGWLWRQWWHFEEVAAIGSSTLGPAARLGVLLGLGRYPETGNILDLLVLGWPLSRLLDFPVDHNVRVLLVLVGNGLCGYALARAHTDSRLAALAASVVAVVNPLVIQDINRTGLRQVLLWWLLLYPLALGRAGRTGRLRDGALTGLAFAATAAFYWFYGLFALMFTLLWLAGWWWRERPSIAGVLPWMACAAAVAMVCILPFLAPYLDIGAAAGSPALPELTFLLPYPSYETVAAAPLRPVTYAENVLSSLHRVIDSSWPADAVVNPAHGVMAFPLAAVLVGVLPALTRRGPRRGSGRWLVIWSVFLVGSWGPFLKLGAQQDTSQVVHLGDFVVRLPWTWMFQFVPGMSRMFAPYRLASMVVVATVVLVALCLGALPRRKRGVLSALTGLAIVLQPFYRFDLGDLGDEAERPPMWRIPTQVSALELPAWYAGLDPEEDGGIVELPLEQQQDLLCAWQVFHHRKVYRSWASLPAVPPEFRQAGGGVAGERLRHLARPEPQPDRARAALLDLSRAPGRADLTALEEGALARLVDEGGYRWLVVHERGYWLSHGSGGADAWAMAVRRLGALLGQPASVSIEIEDRDWPGRRAALPAGPAWVPWASQEVDLPVPELPAKYELAVFDLAAWRLNSDALEGPAGGGAPPTEAEAVGSP